MKVSFRAYYDSSSQNKLHARYECPGRLRRPGHSTLARGGASAPPLHPPPVVDVPPPYTPRFRGKAMNDETEQQDDRKKDASSQNRKRRASIEIALTPEERAEIERRAADAGLSLSSFCRAAALGDAGPRARRRPIVDAVELAKTHAELRRIGNNLNQIAHALNIGETVLFPAVTKAHEDLSIVLFEIARALGYRPE